VTIPKVQAPEFEIAIGAAGGNERRVAGDVHGGDGELVAVQREEEFQCVHEEDLGQRGGNFFYLIQKQFCRNNVRKEKYSYTVFWIRNSLNADPDPHPG